jgi:ribosomal protein S18 acetylase RimI-like enzyme
MFAHSRLAARIERAEASLSRAVAEAARAEGASRALVVDVGGGVAAYTRPHAPVNKMIGLGFDGPVDAAALQAVERSFAERNEPLQAEVSSAADPAILRTLVGRGYRLEGFENVLGMILPRVTGTPRPSDEQLHIGTVDAADAPAWVKILVEGFASPDDVPGAAAAEAHLDEIFRCFCMTEGLTRYGAWWGRALAGGGTLRMHDGIAQLCGTSTHPGYRRRGIQTALIDRRLRDAAAAGCDLATLTAQPGSKSQENAQRQGFTLLYTRALLVKHSADAAAASH